ncbi:MAG: conjugal transfer protein TraI [Chryseolinea sp.]
MNWVKRLTIVVFMTSLCILGSAPYNKSKAAIPIAAIIKEAVKKVIKAVDLMIQRMQNKTIWLQNAQKVLENKLSELKLKEIAEWTEKHRQLYKQYYEELWRIKTAITAYQRIRQIIDKQLRIVSEYKRAWTIVTSDDHFTQEELSFMSRVYQGILHESIRDLDLLTSVITSFNTQMTDAQRLTVITQASDRIEQNYIDLLEFNMQTGRISLNRSRTQNEVERIRSLYGLN